MSLKRESRYGTTDIRYAYVLALEDPTDLPKGFRSDTDNEI
jgi:hypothetical protein